MAFESIGKGRCSGIAEAAMSSTDYRFVKPGTDAEEVLVCGAGEKMMGVRQNSPAINLPVEIVLPGNITKLTLGGTVTKGAWLKSDSAGAGVAATSDAEIVGAMALEAGDSGDVITVLVDIFTLEAA